MATFFRISAWVLAVIVILATGMFLYLRNTDLSVYEDEIEGYLSEAIGHEVNVDGKFELHFGKLTHLTAQQIRITNSDWQPDTELLSVGHLSATIDLWSLLSSPIIVEDFEISDVNIRVEKNAEGKSNWDSGKSKDTPGQKEKFDPNLIAFKEVRVEDVHFILVDPERPRPLKVTLEHLTIKPDTSNILNLDLHAEINEIPLRADGKIGPWQNLLDGLDLKIDLDMTLGPVRLTIDGSIADLSTLADVELTLELQGPAIEQVTDLFGLPEFTEGEFKVDSSIHKIADSNQIKLTGNLGAIEISANGNIDRLINPQRAELEFSFSGPDTMHVAEMFGIDGVVDAPFQISGKVAQEGSRFEFSETRTKIGDNTMTINGWIDTRNTIPDGDISVSASGPDFSVIGPFTGISGIPAETFQIDGRIRKTGASVSFDDVKFDVGKNRITAKGAFTGRGGDENEITFSASGPDISMLQAMTGLQGIPKKPFTISAHLRPDKAGFKLEDATGVFGDNRVEVNGVVGTKRGLTGTDLRVKISGSDLMNVSVLARAPYLPAGPFKVAGQIQIDGDLMSFEEATVVTEGFDASAKGTVGLGLKLGEFKLEVSASSPDLADLLQIEFLDRFAGEDFRIEGSISHQADVFALESVHAFIGSMEADIDGTVANDGSVADLELKVNAPDATVLSKLSGYNDLPGGAVSVSGRFRKTLTDLELGRVEFRMGDNLFTADGTLSIKPLHNNSDLRFSATGPDLHQLGLPFGIDLLVAKAFAVSGEINGVPTGFAIENLDAKIGDNTLTGQFTADLRGKPELSGVLSSSYIDARERLNQVSEKNEEASGEKGEFLFSDKALELDWLQQVNIDIDLNIDHLLVRALDVHDFKIGLNLRDGVLSIDPMSFNEADGKVSGNFHLEPTTGGFEIDVSLNVENARLGFLAFEGQDRSTMPSLNGRLELRGTGNSAHELAASSNGVISFAYGAGRTRDLLGFRRLSNLFTQFLRAGKSSDIEDSYISLECAFYQVGVIDGIATTEKLAVQTDKVTVVANGTVKLANEALDLSIRAKPRKGIGISVLGIAKSFVKLGGTLQKPQMELAAKDSVTAAGAAIVTGGLSLFAKGLWDRASSQKGICDIKKQ